ncbi:MAG TPA: hypothetical protein VJ728_02030 [Candidatus Binataceae bacterium]|nr:hypothetical protein [Candidatus Binataceae bacterium]
MATPLVSQAANLYSLHNNVIQGGQFALTVSYASSGIDGKPHFHYQDAHQTLDFAGDQIRTVESDVGTVVTVTIRLTVDSGSTTFSLVVPAVRLGRSGRAHISTLGITTIHRFSIVPQFNLGQLETYTVSHLEGTAEFVEF